MPKYLKSLFIVFAALYFLFLVISRTPASWVAYSLHASVPNLWLTGVSGSAWDGLARGAQFDLGDAQIPMGSFRWEVSPLSLLLLSPCVKFESEFAGQPFSGEVCQSVFGATKLHDFVLDAPVETFAELIPIKVGGDASLQVVSATLNGVLSNEIAVEALDGRFTLQNARLNPGNGWMNLGTYAAVLKAGENGDLTASVLDIEATLGVDIDASWTVASEEFTAVGTIVTSENSPPDAVSAIQIFGEEKEPDVYFVQWP